MLTYAQHNPWVYLARQEIPKRSSSFSVLEDVTTTSLDAENYQATVNLTALYTRTRDRRREQQAARLEVLQQKRGERAQDFLRMIEVVPPSP